MLNRRNFGLLAAATGLAMGLSLGAAHAETLTVGAYPANPPWEFKKEDGSFEGFEVDLMREVGKRLGMDVEFQDLGFQALFAATASGRIDAAISSITITAERTQAQDFTQGYVDADLSIATRKDSGVKTLADLKGKPVGAISSSTGDKWIKENTESAGLGDFKGYNSQQDLLLDIQAGRVAAGIGDITNFEYAFKNMTDLTVAERIPTGDRYAVMLQKGSPLSDKIDGAITEMKKDGTMAALYEKHLGSKPEAGTSMVTVMDRPKAE